MIFRAPWSSAAPPCLRVRPQCAILPIRDAPVRKRATAISSRNVLFSNPSRARKAAGRVPIPGCHGQAQPRHVFEYRLPCFPRSGSISFPRPGCHWRLARQCLSRDIARVPRQSFFISSPRGPPHLRRAACPDAIGIATPLLGCVPRRTVFP